MRISEDRYSRDLRRIHLAQRMIRHEVRTQWICTWSGLSACRVRNLFKSYQATLHGPRRHRGPSPKRIASFLRSPALRAEASGAGALACVLGVVPAKPLPDARKTLPSVECGERLCQVYELYQRIVPESHLSMDQLIILVIALTEGEELMIGHCSNCHGALLLDRLGASRRRCQACRLADTDSTVHRALLSDGPGNPDFTPGGAPRSPAQGSLF